MRSERVHALQIQARERISSSARAGRRWQRVLALALVTGVVTGVGVAAFEWIAIRVLFDHALLLPAAALALVPVIGLTINELSLRYIPPGRTSGATSDAYIGIYHDEERRLDPRRFVPRVLAGIATLGSGGALGLEGPSMYIGASVGDRAHAYFSRFFERSDAKVLLVAGAAAGVAAIFKAPATGVIFALEVPFQTDLARRALIPALVAAAAGYVTFVSFAGTSPLFSVTGAPAFNLKDLGGAALIGICAGIGARGFAYLLRAAKEVARRSNPTIRILVAGAALSGLYVASKHLFGDPLSLGPGYRAVAWASAPGRGSLLVFELLAIRCVAAVATLGGGGTGGLFIPLVVEGTVLGRLVGNGVGVTGPLFPMLGLAAFLGAGYRTPLAAVVFVAESTGRAGFVVPALIAAAVSQLFMGRKSVTDYQRAERATHLERRFALPISSAMRTDVVTVAPETSLREFVTQHLIGARLRSVPVVEDGRYLGMMRMRSLAGYDESEWSSVKVTDAMDREGAVGSPTWRLGEAVSAMEEADIDILPVVDDRGTLAGIVTTGDILKLDQALEAAEGSNQA